jgi:hypothetical protein
MLMTGFSGMSMLLLDDGSDRESLLGLYSDIVSAEFLFCRGPCVGYGWLVSAGIG